jgi:hypothetical protein
LALTYFRLTNSGLHQLVRLGVCLLRPVFFSELAGTTIRSPDFGFNNRDVLLLGELPRFRNSENVETYDRPRQGMILRRSAFDAGRDREVIDQ